MALSSEPESKDPPSGIEHKDIVYEGLHDKVLTVIDAASKTSASVLITGEPGTGKSSIAQGIHNQSDRRSKPFNSVGLQGMEDYLTYSRLFGNDNGAFGRAEGLFAASAHGTLLLNRVEALGDASKAQVLRVLKGEEFYPIGSHSSIKSTARVIAATEADMEQAIRENELMKELARELEIHIKMPPLRQRGHEALHQLAHQFTFEYSNGQKALSKEAMAWLRAKRLRWPGNIKQLKTVIKLACANAPHQEITPQDLEPYYKDYGENNVKPPEQNRRKNIGDLLKLCPAKGKVPTAARRITILKAMVGTLIDGEYFPSMKLWEISGLAMKQFLQFYSQLQKNINDDGDFRCATDKDGIRLVPQKKPAAAPRMTAPKSNGSRNGNGNGAYPPIIQMSARRTDPPQPFAPAAVEPATPGPAQAKSTPTAEAQATPPDETDRTEPSSDTDVSGHREDPADAKELEPSAPPSEPAPVPVDNETGDGEEEEEEAALDPETGDSDDEEDADASSPTSEEESDGAFTGDPDTYTPAKQAEIVQVLVNRTNPKPHARPSRTQLMQALAATLASGEYVDYDRIKKITGDKKNQGAYCFNYVLERFINERTPFYCVRKRAEGIRLVPKEHADYYKKVKSGDITQKAPSKKLPKKVLALHADIDHTKPYVVKKGSGNLGLVGETLFIVDPTGPDYAEGARLAGIRVDEVLEELLVYYEKRGERKYSKVASINDLKSTDEKDDEDAGRRPRYDDEDEDEDEDEDDREDESEDNEGELTPAVIVPEPQARRSPTTFKAAARGAVSIGVSRDDLSKKTKPVLEEKPDEDEDDRRPEKRKGKLAQRTPQTELKATAPSHYLATAQQLGKYFEHNKKSIPADLEFHALTDGEDVIIIDMIVTGTGEHTQIILESNIFNFKELCKTPEVEAAIKGIISRTQNLSEFNLLYAQLDIEAFNEDRAED